jgi:hypothetical protein
MQSLEAGTAAPANRTTLHLALAAFADEAVGTLARLIAYVGSLVLFAILALAALGHLPALHDDAPVAQPGWSAADRSHPAFAVTRLDSIDKSVSYTILRHPRGGRRDLIRWSGETDTPLAELEIYREGEEFDLARPSTEALAARMGLQPAALEQAGLIDTKFGPVALFKPIGATPACLFYLKRSEEPALQISGFSCQGDSLPARRTAIACTLNRLTLLTSGNEPKLADLFARAELKRRACDPAGPSDWLLGSANAQLRGAL